MKQLALVFCTIILLTILAVPGHADVPGQEDILAESAILMDGETGQILYEKNARQQMQPASITKILTAILVLENLDTGATVTASEEAVDIPYWGSSAYIEAGERLTVDQAMYAMMLRSANEAANILAEEVSGSLSGFATLMNQRAVELGAEGTHFTNANGLPAPDHYTTARDMALITRQALQTPGFLTYFGASDYAMSPTNKFADRYFANTHKMLQSYSFRYNDWVIGGKTGYTTPSGYTLVTVAQEGGRTLICVVLKSSSYYEDTQTLLEFGFGEFTPYTYVFEDGDTITVSIWEDDWEAGQATLHQPESASFLLHQSVSPKSITELLLYPDEVRQGEEIEASAVITAQVEEDGLPDVLLTIPLEVKVETFDPPEVAETMVTLGLEPRLEGEQHASSSLVAGVVTVVAVLLGGIAAVYWVGGKKQNPHRVGGRGTRIRRYK